MLGRQRYLFRRSVSRLSMHPGRKCSTNSSRRTTKVVMCASFPPPSPLVECTFVLLTYHPRDLNTRSSGIRLEEYATHAVLVPLESVRRALNGLIGADTILTGHASTMTCARRTSCIGGSSIWPRSSLTRGP